MQQRHQIVLFPPAQRIEQLQALFEVDAPAIIGIDEIEIPKFRPLVEIRHAWRGDFEKRLGE